MRLTGRICPIDEVSERDRDQMFALMEQYYENISRESFERDFCEKDVAIVARHPNDGTVCGFSTQMVYTQSIGKETVRILFSGDTIIDQQHWGNNPLARLWGQYALSQMDLYPNERFYWFLISKGYKTYRFLPVYFHEFYPRFDRPTPAWAAQVLSEVAKAKFGPRFREATGILDGAEDACRLRKSVADVTSTRLQDPHVAFFQRVNPGHVLGDELCCIAPLSRENLNRTAFYVIGEKATEPAVAWGSGINNSETDSGAQAT